MRQTLFLGLLLSAAAFVCGCSRSAESPHFYEEIRSVDRLVLARMSVSKMATISDIRPEEAKGPKQKLTALIDAVKIGDRVAAYSYDTYLRAYIDLSQLAEEDVDIDSESKTVRLTLPDVKVETEGRELALKEEHYRVTGLRSQIDAKERARLKEQMNAAVKQEIARNPAFKEALAEKARSKAQAYFTDLLASQGYKADIVFQSK